MANQLRAAGQEVALLALLDPTCHVGRLYVTLDQWLERNEATAPGQILRQTTRYSWFRLGKIGNDLYDRARRAVLFPIWNHYRGRPSAPPRALPRPLRRPDRANRLIRLEHRRLPHYPGDAVQFRARFTPRSREHTDIRDAWRHVIEGTLTEVTVPGLHHQIIQEPYAGELARALGDALDEAYARAGADPVVKSTGRNYGSPAAVTAQT
jgi:thioesterase domain-containing protein